MKSLSSFLTLLFFILVVISGFIFTINNSGQTPLWLGVGLSPRPLSLWVLGAFIAGGFCGLLLGLGFWRALRNKWKLRHLENRLQQQDKELDLLRQQLKTIQKRKEES